MQAMRKYLKKTEAARKITLTVKISWTYNEKRVIRELNTHKNY